MLLRLSYAFWTLFSLLKSTEIRGLINVDRLFFINCLYCSNASDPVLYITQIEIVGCHRIATDFLPKPENIPVLKMYLFFRINAWVSLCLIKIKWLWIYLYHGVTLFRSEFKSALRLIFWSEALISWLFKLSLLQSDFWFPLEAHIWSSFTKKPEKGGRSADLSPTPKGMLNTCRVTIIPDKRSWSTSQQST